MPASLFVEHHPHGIAFYINGHLQFDSADEAIYHEHLVVPAIALTQQRFAGTDLRVLICGGGDGLAARDVLRFAAVTDLTLVDYSPEVLDLGRTTFKPYNQGSLVLEQDAPLGGSRITVYTEEAFAFVSQLPDRCFHAVICDFTSPTTTQETAIYSREWFSQVQRILQPGGVVAVNAVSPDDTTSAFWCLYQTLHAAGLPPKPMRIPIPSFAEMDYGDWGFFLASAQPILRSELETLTFPDHLQVLRSPDWLEVFRLPAAIAAARHSAIAHTLDAPQLLYYLLNPQSVEPQAVEPQADQADPSQVVDGAIDPSSDWVNFLDITETGNGLVGEQDALQLAAIAQRWLDYIKTHQGDPNQLPPLDQLMPVQHSYHEPQMVAESTQYWQAIAQQIDLEKLLTTLLERAKDVPPQIKQELQGFVQRLRSGEALQQLSDRSLEWMTVLFVILVMANLTMPDSVFAKGFSSGGVRSFSGSGYRTGSSGSSGSDCYDSYGNYICSTSDGNFGWMGFLMMIGGFVWLSNLNNQPKR